MNAWSQNLLQETRRIIFPIDGALDVASVVSQARDFFGNEDTLPYVGMLKLNDALAIPGIGPDMLSRVREVIPDHVELFADLKIVDVNATVLNVLKLRYAHYKPKIVTVFSGVTAKTLSAIRDTLPDTQIALVDTLTDMSAEECYTRYGMYPGEKIASAINGFDRILGNTINHFDLVVCSANDLEFLKMRFGDRFGFVCPGIRDEWMLAKGNEDHQKRISGIFNALSLGAAYAVMGSQLSNGNPRAGISPQESRRRTWSEMKRFFNGEYQ